MVKCSIKTGIRWRTYITSLSTSSPSSPYPMQSQALLKGKSIKVMGVQNTGLSSKSTTRSSSSPAPKGQVWKSVTAFNDVLNNINAPRKKRKRKVPPPCGLPCYSYLERTPNAQLYYIWETHEANIVLERSSLCSQNISGKNRVYMGFDMEWAPVHQKGVPQNPVALIQLATEYEIFLLQIYRMEGKNSMSLSRYFITEHEASNRIST